MLDTIALVYYVGFYGLFLLVSVGHLMNPYALPGAYDVAPGHGRYRPHRLQEFGGAKRGGPPCINYGR